MADLNIQITTARQAKNNWQDLTDSQKNELVANNVILKGIMSFINIVLRGASIETKVEGGVIYRGIDDQGKIFVIDEQHVPVFSFTSEENLAILQAIIQLPRIQSMLMDLWGGEMPPMDELFASLQPEIIPTDPELI